MAPKRRERCQRNHSDWAIHPTTGYRYCHACHVERNLGRNRKNPEKGIAWADSGPRDRGPRLQAFTRSEILKARGML